MNSERSPSIKSEEVSQDVPETAENTNAVAIGKLHRTDRTRNATGTMDTATIPCQLVDLNNNCQCRSAILSRPRAPRTLEVSALHTPLVQLKQSAGYQRATREKRLARIGRTSIKRHNIKWHPYVGSELQPDSVKMNIEQPERAFDQEESDTTVNTSKAEELSAGIIVGSEKLESVDCKLTCT
uniref:Uncharacterized protein n=1 Tax=Anopheles minimus TaxID=112268 RepID=A0A182WPR1_9DIPT